MRLALIRQRFTGFGGAELYVNQLAKRLLEKGHEVHVLARRWSTNGDARLVLHGIRSWGGPAFIRLPSFARVVAKEVAAGSFDLVHSFERTYSQDIFRAGDGCHREWLDRRARVQGVWRAGLDRVNPRHRAFLDLETRMFNDPRLKIVIANSQQGRDEIIRHYGLPEHMIRVVYNGLDRNRFYPGLSAEYRLAGRRELELDEGEPVLLFVGSGYVRKGLGSLIAAMPQVEAKLLVVGRDRCAPFQRMARRLGVEDRVVFLGPRSDVERWYGVADVFVLPSWYEPFSNACLEAMASGLPVVTTRETGAAEVIAEGLNGHTVGFPVDPGELAGKIRSCLQMNQGALVEANMDILRPFDWEKNIGDTMQAYDDCLLT